MNSEFQQTENLNSADTADTEQCHYELQEMNLLINKLTGIQWKYLSIPDDVIDQWENPCIGL